MSKLGKMPIKLNTGVAMTNTDGKIKVKGPKGELEVLLMPGVIVEEKEGMINVSVEDAEIEHAKAYWGLVRSLLNNANIGVSDGYFIDLELVGVGYRVEKVGNDLKILIGYSHPVEVKAPEGITFEVEGNTNIKVVGIDKQLVGQTAANIRAIRSPEPYKGKGIKYKTEIIKRKQGKAAKAG